MSKEIEAKKVLVVDDEADSRDFICSVLQEEGLETFQADGGLKAVETASEVEPDLIILDIQMPDKNGLDVIMDLRLEAETAKIPVIMLTGIANQVGLHFSADEMVDWVGERPEAYLEKPVSPPELKRTVRKVLEK